MKKGVLAVLERNGTTNSTNKHECSRDARTAYPIKQLMLSYLVSVVVKKIKTTTITTLTTYYEQRQSLRENSEALNEVKSHKSVQNLPNLFVEFEKIC